MKKVFKILKNLLVIIIAIILFTSLTVYIYHNYRLSKESALIQSNQINGTLVDINNKKINVYNEGIGEDTYVFMPGSGIVAPVYEMKGLYSKFSKENKIAVIERGGYGYSDVFNDDRDIDIMLEQTRTALIRSGNKPPYILVPHSISGLEAIYWAQKYPNEIKGIIALDVGLPKEYVTYKIGLANSLAIRGMNILTKIGYHRLMPSATYDPEVIRQSFLTKYEKDVFKALSYKQALNDDVEQEILQIYDNARKSVDLPIPKETPILFLSAYTDQNKNSKYTKQKNKNYEEYAEQVYISNVKKIKGKHSIYLYAPDEIYNISLDFIEKKVKRIK